MSEKKYKWESRYKFNTREILKDFKNVGEFRSAYGVTRTTYLRGFKNTGKYAGKFSAIPSKYIIDKQTSMKVLLCEGVVVAKNEKEATHLFEIKDGKLVLRSRRCKA